MKKTIYEQKTCSQSKSKYVSLAKMYLKYQK